jgi:transmembrane sensor
MDFDTYLRHARRQATPAEDRAVQAWLANPANAPLARKWMQQHADLLEQEDGPAEEMPDFEAVQAELMAKLGLTPAQPHKQRLIRWPYWVSAAVLLIGLMTGGAWLWQAKHSMPVLTTVATAYGELRTVQLPDGSTVKMNGHSTLRYAADLSTQSQREVWLDGEGYFSVKHLADNRRFVVHTTAGLQVEVLGTQFTVYRRHEQARVVLLTGKVRVDFADPARRREVVLKPGELLETFDAPPRRIEHKAVNTALYASWADNKLVFDETSLADVATRLSDTYGVAVSVAPPALSQYKVSGTFPVGNLEAVLQFLEKSFPLTIQRQPKQVIISANPSTIAR